MKFRYIIILCLYKMDLVIETFNIQSIENVENILSSPPNKVRERLHLSCSLL